MIHRTALVTGAARGIGAATAARLADDGFAVAVVDLDADAAVLAAGQINAAGGTAIGIGCDVADEAQVAAAVARTVADFGSLDVLVNNAGVLLDEAETALTVPLDVVRATFEVDVLGPWAVTQAFAPLLRASAAGRVVNVSSTAGSLTDLAAGAAPGAWGPPAYCVAKAALNALTILEARAFAGTPVLVNACCPGWLRTAMGGPSAPLSAREGADTPLFLATLPDGGPTGGFFADRRPIPW